jgi:hypothetical protein
MRDTIAIVDVLCRLVHRHGVFYYCLDKNTQKEKKGVGNSSWLILSAMTTPLISMIV